MSELRYDKASVESIVEFAKRLTGKSLAEVEHIPAEIVNSSNKGDLGSLVETFFFNHQPPTNKGPDFEEAGLELKVTGVLADPKVGFKAKERLVLTMINYEEIVYEDWETSTLVSKCQLMLILFYLYEKSRPSVDRRFVLDPLLYKLLDSDAAVIRRDWEVIKEKVIAGKAHELSEGDTFYLAAARKGSGGADEPLRKQPFSDEGAKARAFSFKPSYVNHLIQGHLRGKAAVDNAGEVPKAVLGITTELPFEMAISSKFEAHLGKSVDELSAKFGLIKLSKNQKGFHRQLAVRILADGGNDLPELDKAEIEMKTIRLSATGRPREAMSFPGFKFLEIVEQSWEDSAFSQKLEKKFLFVVYKPDVNGVERLVGAKLWNMPYVDRVEARRVWEDTRRRVSVDATDLPRISESKVAHVRPKGRDGNDKILTPQGTMHLKQAFWLNQSYIAEVLTEFRV